MDDAERHCFPKYGRNTERCYFFCKPPPFFPASAPACPPPFFLPPPLGLLVVLLLLPADWAPAARPEDGMSCPPFACVENMPSYYYAGAWWWHFDGLLTWLDWILDESDFVLELFFVIKALVCCYIRVYNNQKYLNLSFVGIEFLTSMVVYRKTTGRWWLNQSYLYKLSSCWSDADNRNNRSERNSRFARSRIY